MRYELTAEDLSNEEWKDVPRFEKSYQVSNMGRVRSVGRYAETKAFGGGFYWIHEKILKQEPVKNGYLRVTVSIKGKTKRFISHRLVALVWVENPNKYKFVNHKKGIKTDNRATEIEWCTSSENEKHSYRRLGKVSPEAKLTLDTESGIFYDSISQAAIARCIKPGYLLKLIYKGKNRTSIQVV